MQRRSSSRYLFFFVLCAIVIVYAIGRQWLEHGARPAKTEAGMVPEVAPAGD
jgi:hypothetical protein